MTGIVANKSTRNATVRRAFVIGALAVAMSAPEGADNSGLKRRIEALKKEVRLLKEVDLWEVSLVTFPMQPEARISHFKNMPICTPREYETFLRDAGRFSRMEAKALTALGFDGLLSQRDAGDDWSGVLKSIEHLEHILTSKGD